MAGFLGLLVAIGRLSLYLLPVLFLLALFQLPLSDWLTANPWLLIPAGLLLLAFRLAAPVLKKIRGYDG